MKISIIFLLSLNLGIISAQDLPKLVPYKEGGKFGYINTRLNKIIIKPAYDDAYPFHYNCSLGVVSINKKYFLINEKGEKVSDFPNLGDLYYNEEYDVQDLTSDYKTNSIEFYSRFFLFEDFRFGELFIQVLKKNAQELYCIIDAKGGVVSNYYDLIYRPEEDYAIIKLNEKYGLLNIHGKELISPKYENIEAISNKDTLLKYIFNKKTVKKVKGKTDTICNNIIDRDKIENWYLKSIHGSNLMENYNFYRTVGNVVFIRNKYWEIYDSKGENLNNNKYGYLYKINSNYYIAANNKYIYVINKNGEEVFETKKITTPGIDTLFLDLKNGKWGVIDLKNEVVIKHLYESPFYFIENVARIKENGAIYYIDINGREYISSELDR